MLYLVGVVCRYYRHLGVCCHSMVEPLSALLITMSVFSDSFLIAKCYQCCFGEVYCLTVDPL